MQPKIAVIYHHFPHYRAPVMRALVESLKFDFEFYGSIEEFAGIQPYKGDDLVKIHHLDVHEAGRAYRISGYLGVVLNPKISACIIIGNPNIHSTWIMAAIARLTGKRVLYWTHGWLRKEPLAKRLVRNVYLGLANMVLVYSDRAKRIGVDSGFNPSKITPIYNSLNFTESTRIYEALCNEQPISPFIKIFDRDPKAVLIYTGRLIKESRIELLLEAGQILKEGGSDIAILIVGTGPLLEKLKHQAESIDIPIRFFGSCYDEEVLGKLIFQSAVLVSPGKIGLAAIHGMTYGTPVISHDNLDEQMPEVEAIHPGINGDLFRQDDPFDLANTIRKWINPSSNRSSIRSACRRTVCEQWNPITQRELIEKAISSLIASTK